MLSILGYDTKTRTVYGVVENRKAYIKYQLENNRKIFATSEKEWYRVREADSTILATEISFIQETPFSNTIQPNACLKIVDSEGNSLGGNIQGDCTNWNTWKLTGHELQF